jgi:uncharacterized protein
MFCAFLLPLRLFLAAGLLALLMGGAQAQDVQPLPPLAAHVTDTVGLLSVDRREAIEARLVALEREKGAQVAVLLVATTRPEAIEEYALRVAEAGRLGRKGVDDGVLFVVARDDRRMRIEVGRGLEGAIPDAIAKRIIADVVTPYFKAGDFPRGVEAGVDAIAARVSGEPLPAPPVPGQGGDGAMGLEELLVVGMIVTIVIGGILRAIFGRLLGATLASGLVGFGAWTLTGALAIGVVGGLLAFVFVLVMGSGGGTRHTGGPWSGGGMGGMGGGGFGRGGGWSGGGGGFGGGGASGGW